MTIEEKFSKLEELVKKVEDQSIDLTNSLKYYEEAKKIIDEINKELKETELKITKIDN